MNQPTNRFEFSGRIVIFLLAALIPIWFIPWSFGVEFGRELTFTFLIVTSVIVSLLSVLTRGEIRFQYSPLILGGVLLFVVFGISTLFSKAPLFSAILADPSAERLFSLLLGIFLMYVVGSVLGPRDVGLSLFILVFSGAVGALIHFVQFWIGFSPYKFITPLAGNIDFNAIGTVNGLALFYGVLLLMSLGVLFSSAFWRAGIAARVTLLAILAVFFANLLFINFRTTWFMLFGSGIFLLGLVLKDARKGGTIPRGGDQPKRSLEKLDWRYLIATGMVVFSMVMIMVRNPIFSQLPLPAEVSPSMKATLLVAKSVFSEGPLALLLGSGPGTFGIDWSLYHDPTVNQTVFWNIRFNQGYSFISTLVATTGIVGTIAFLLFLGAAAFLFLKKMLAIREEERPVATGLFFGFLGLLFLLFLYPANLTFLLLFFFVTGLLTVVLSERAKGDAEKEEIPLLEESHETMVSMDPMEEKRESILYSIRSRLIAPKSWSFGLGPKAWVISERTVVFQSQWAIFLSSLIVVFLLSLGAATLYLEVGRGRAMVIAQKGVAAFTRGNIDEAIGHFETAIGLDPNNFRNHQSLAQVRIEKVRGLIGRATRGENVQQEFQSTIAAAIENVRRSIELHPREPLLWRTQGALYEALILFVPGSERFAIDSYRRAAELDPLNPTIWVDMGRVALTFSDGLQLVLSQGRAANKGELEQARSAALQEAAVAFKKASEIKADFAPAHFLFAQTAIRLGDLRSAIQSTEQTKLVAPFDIGVAFQLGLLYYQAGDLNRAGGEFMRAVSLNENYSNARYFLGLIYDRNGERDKAISEFQKVEALNPDNQEVKQILINLRAGRFALESIVPPGEPPEKRKATPVGEESRSRGRTNK